VLLNKAARNPRKLVLHAEEQALPGEKALGVCGGQAAAMSNKCRNRSRCSLQVRGRDGLLTVAVSCDVM